MKKISIAIMLLFLSIENAFGIDATFYGFGIVDVGILLSFFLFVLSIYMEKRTTNDVKIPYYILIVSLFLFFHVFYAFANHRQFKHIFADARNIIFLAISFEIFKSKKFDKEFFYKVVPFAGFLNSVIFLTSSGLLAGNYERNIYIPLWISVYSLIFILFNVGNLKKIYWLVFVLNLIAILVSQTRSYIFPVIIAIVMYAFFVLKKLKFSKIFLILIAIVSVYFILSGFGLDELVLSRLEGSFSNESTMALRFNNSFIQIKQMSFLQLIFGRGIGERFDVVTYLGNIRECSDLEMFLFNQILEMGVIYVVVNVVFFFKHFRFKKIKTIDRFILVSTLSILAGGFISGMVGLSGSVTLGLLFGLFENENTQ